ncbi:hypothetical protein NECAME_06150 [Necator americanus]|uniref:Uncharacterized protein n=1 Tax=Necator americanus TaxID=51031 RepID=W2TXY6_NECAM|nr:hypothetical protein NECAME_06150 [Necator americanus]ETN85906.1 hypothetical protein NECAME_06150 [Necator americanus]
MGPRNFQIVGKRTLKAGEAIAQLFKCHAAKLISLCISFTVISRSATTAHRRHSSQNIHCSRLSQKPESRTLQNMSHLWDLYRCDTGVLPTIQIFTQLNIQNDLKLVLKLNALIH